MKDSELKYKAWLWDGQHQMAGTLSLDADRLTFRPEQFKTGNLQITIRYLDIMTIEEFLLYDLTKNGLRIATKKGKVDSFVMEDSRLIREKLMAYTNR